MRGSGGLARGRIRVLPAYPLDAKLSAVAAPVGVLVGPAGAARGPGFRRGAWAPGRTGPGARGRSGPGARVGRSASVAPARCRGSRRGGPEGRGPAGGRRRSPGAEGPAGRRARAEGGPRRWAGCREEAAGRDGRPGPRAGRTRGGRGRPGRGPGAAGAADRWAAGRRGREARRSARPAGVGGRVHVAGAAGRLRGAGAVDGHPRAPTGEPAGRRVEPLVQVPLEPRPTTGAVAGLRERSRGSGRWRVRVHEHSVAKLGRKHDVGFRRTCVRCRGPVVDPDGASADPLPTCPSVLPPAPTALPTSTWRGSSRRSRPGRCPRRSSSGCSSTGPRSTRTRPTVRPAAPARARYAPSHRHGRRPSRPWPDVDRPGPPGPRRDRWGDGRATPRAPRLPRGHARCASAGGARPPGSRTRPPGRDRRRPRR